MRKYTFYTTCSVFAFVQVLSSHSNSNEIKSYKYNFKLGLNNSFTYDQSDFKSSYTGIG